MSAPPPSLAAARSPQAQGGAGQDALRGRGEAGGRLGTGSSEEKGGGGELRKSDGEASASEPPPGVKDAVAVGIRVLCQPGSATVPLDLHRGCRERRGRGVGVRALEGERRERTESVCVCVSERERG